MQGLVCDRCNKSLLVDEDVRYVVEMQVYAAYDPMEVTHADLKKVDAAAMRTVHAQLSKLTSEEAQNQVYRDFRFDLCPPCQKQFLETPWPAPESS